VLSHSGFEEDLRLAQVCPFIDVVFAGHCHSSQYGPVHVGDTTVLKGYELGAGYACAEPSDRGWATQVSRLPDAIPSRLSDELEPVRARIRAAGRELSAALGPVSAPYRHTALDRRVLLTDVVNRLRVGATTDAVLLNETALRTATLSDTLTRGDLIAVEPFDNQLVRATVPDRFQDNPDYLAAHLTAYAGPIVTAPVPLPQRLRTVLTTGNLADALAAPADATGIPLAQAVRHALTEGTDVDPHRP
jgi:hypothetical protein